MRREATRNGHDDEHPFVQAFARYRRESIQAAAEVAKEIGREARYLGQQEVAGSIAKAILTLRDGG